MGVSLALLSAVFLTIRDVVSKQLSSKVESITSAFASFLFAIPFYLIILVGLYFAGYENFIIGSSFYLWVILRAFVDSAAEYGKMVALKNADLSIVSSIFTLYPILMLFLSPILTGDQLTLKIIIGVIFSVLGSMVILYKPSSASNNRTGLWAAGISCIFFSVNACLDRLAVQEASATLSGFAMTFFAGLVLLPFVLRKRHQVHSLVVNTRAFLSRGLFECLFMVAKLGALKFISAPQLSTFKNISLLFAVFSGKKVFQETNVLRKVIGAILSIVGMIIAL